MSPYPTTAEQTLRDLGITVASDTAEFRQISAYSPVDATTNPSLVLAATTKPEYSQLLTDAVKYADERRRDAPLSEKTELALDKLLVSVGAEILALIPGRVSVSADPRLGNSYDGIVNKGLSLMTLFDEMNIPRHRVLIKIPATWDGIRAAQTLEHDYDIRTNLTLVFSLVQALACAQAGVSVISPFIGRVKDWWHAKMIAAGRLEGLEKQPLSEHPGIHLVRRIRSAFRANGYATEVMAAGFRKPEEVLELVQGGRRRGPDLVTIPPDLLEGLRRIPGIQDNVLEENFGLTESSVAYFDEQGPVDGGYESFERDMVAEEIGVEKVPEGLAKFSADADKLEERVGLALVNLESSYRSPRSPHLSYRQKDSSKKSPTISVEV